MNHDEATMKALAEEVRKVYRSSSDAPRLFRDYFGDFYQTITGAIEEDLEQRHRREVEDLNDVIDELESKVSELNGEIGDLDG